MISSNPPADLFEAMGPGYCLLELVRDPRGRAVDHRLLKVNPAFERLIGIPAAEAEGRTGLELVPGLEREITAVFDRVARRGESEHFEQEVSTLKRWYDVWVYPAGGDRVSVLYEEITERKRSERILRASEQRLAFMLKLSDALRPISDPTQAQSEAMRVLGEHLQISRAQYFEFDHTGQYAEARGGYARNVSSRQGRFRLDDFGKQPREAYEDGLTFVAEDTAKLPADEHERSSYEAAGTRAAVGAPITKDGRLVAVLGVSHHEPRKWTLDELSIIEETAERVWIAAERAKAELALRERVADLARVQRIGRVAGINIDIVHGLRSWRSPEYLRLHGLREDVTLEQHADWRERVHPDDRDAAERALVAALRADDAIYDSEYRIIRPNDGAVRWIHARAYIERGDDGIAVRLIGAHVDVTEQKRMQETLRENEAWLAVQKEAFRSAMDGAPLPTSLGLLTRAATERWGADCRGAFYIATPDGRTLNHVVGMPPEYAERVNGFEISTESLSCGLAVATGKAVITADVREDPRCKAWLWIARQFDFRACWSFPVESDSGKIVGSLALYFREPREPDARDLEATAAITHTAAIIISQHQAVTALRESQRRQQFLLELSDALRPLSDPAQIQGEAARRLGESLGAGWAFYCEYADDYTRLIVRADHHRGDGPSLVGVHPVTSLSFMSELAAGRTTALPDATTSTLFSEEARARWTAFGMRSVVAVPIIKDGKLISALVVCDTAPRDWTPDIPCVEETAQRTWAAVERGHAEAARRDSETLLAASFEALPVAISVMDAAGRLTFSNREIARFLPTGRMPSRDDERGWRWRAWHPDGRPVEPHDFPGARALRGDRVVPGIEMLYAQDDGREVWTTVASVPIRDEQGRVTGNVSVINDIDVMKRGVDALRASDQRLRQFARGSSGALWIRDAATLNMEYVSPAVSTLYGVAPSAFLGDVKLWAAAIVPEDRALAIKHLEQAVAGEAVVHEFRIQRPTDLAFRWIRNTDFPLFDENGLVQRIGGIAEDVTESKLAIQHQDVLVAELQHRVRNIMAVIRTIAARTGARAESVAEYAALMSGRLLAFARVQALLTRTANMSVGIGSVVREELNAHAQHDGQYTIAGDEIGLAPKAAEILTLVVHELATNAMKYGALAAAGGKVDVRWEKFYKFGAPWLRFDWWEAFEAAPPAAHDQPRRRGFGSELIEARVPYELQGTGHLTIGPGSARCQLEFPLAEGASVLETSAPTRARVFGGSLDMTEGPDLRGRRVLVVEDEYLVASDTARALQSAGAEVLGPAPTAARAHAELEKQRPDAAVVDINLGGGPSFELAGVLAERGIPFVFVTGYDAKVIPEEFRSIARLQKPVQLRQLTEAVERLS